LEIGDPLKVLVVAPHADDECIGLGGTIARHVREGDHVTVAVMTGPGTEPHPVFPHSQWDVIRKEADQACQVLGVQRLWFRELPAVLVPDLPVWEINQEAGHVLAEVEPDILYVPFPFDLHLDHRAIYYAFSVAWRPHTPLGQRVKEVYAYETLSETHWNPPYLEPSFTPNHFVDISDTLELKMKALNCYASQIQPEPHFRSLRAIEALATLRGSQVSMAAAEGFVLIRRLCPR
jgi:N-acetylglucosamine malate deacetylase 1